MEETQIKNRTSATVVVENDIRQESVNGLKICGNCGFLVKKRDEFVKCLDCGGQIHSLIILFENFLVFLHKKCPISVNKEEERSVPKEKCNSCLHD